MIAKLLRRYPLLRLLTPRQLGNWLAEGRQLDYARGATLLQEDTPGAWLYLVRAGRVRILRQSGAREVTLGTFRPGDVFGEYALLSPGLNTATCRTATEAQLLRLPLAPLRTALQGHEPVWKNLKNWLQLHTLLHFQRERAFLGFMSAESGLKLLDRLKPATFTAGETIQTNRLAVDRWHLIDRGTVRLQAQEPASAEAEEIGPGEAFGESGLRGAGDLEMAVAVGEVHCLVLVRSDFHPGAVGAGSKQSYQSGSPVRPAAHVWVPQVEPADCGLAALTMVGQRLGVNVSVEQLRQQVAPGPDGLSLQQLRHLADAIGLTCRAVRVCTDRLGQVSFPAIAHLRDGHYVVLHEASPAGVIVGDPAAGILTWHGDFLAQCYSGSLLLFDRPPSPT